MRVAYIKIIYIPLGNWMTYAEPNAENESPIGDGAQSKRTTERLVAMDAIRGFAVLGILAMNIVSIGLPGAARLNPLLAGGFEGFNRLLWWIGYLLFDEKMIALFSMLFGAGLVLQADRALQAGRSPARLFYRRAAVLLLIGLGHAYLLWEGDILVTYAMCGMLVYPFRWLSPRLLIPLGLVVMLVAIPFGLLIGGVLEATKNAAARIAEMERKGGHASQSDLSAATNWAEIRRSFKPSPEELAANLAQDRGETYIEHIRRKAPEALAVQTQLFVAAFLWLVSGRMLIGMGLMKAGVFSGSMSSRFYLGLMVVGYGAGLPLVYLSGAALIAREFDPVAIFGGLLLFNSFAGMLVALGHIGLVVTVSKAGWLPALTQRLVAVGRMALTNYLVQSLVCASLFCGWGFALIGRLDRTALCALMLGIWLAQLVYSPLWLARFSFGPAEWLWRSLTLGKWQSMRISS